MSRLIAPLWIAFLCLIAQDQRPAREEARDLDNLSGGIIHIDNKNTSSPDYLAQHEPLKFLQLCLDRYDREVKGYTCTFNKVERIGGKLRRPERIFVAFREQPFSVYFHWLEGKEMAEKVVFERGKNNNKLLAKVVILGITSIWERDTDGADAKKTGRYTIDQFGIHLGTMRTLASMRKAEERGELHLEYKGIIAVPQLDDRLCHTFVRKPYVPLEEEGVNELTIFIDEEYLLQTGSILKDAKGNLIAEYFFTDLKLNPELRDVQFQRAALK